MNDVDDYWKNLAERHLDANELAQAHVCIIHHAELHPHDKRLLTRFQIMLALGHYESAHCIMETLCPLDKSSSAHPVLLLTHGKLYFAQRDYQNAEKYYRAACQRHAERPGDAGGLSQSAPVIFLGSCVARQGRMLEAIEIYQRATQFSLEEGNDPDEAWANIGYAYRAMGQFKEAQTAFAKALEVCAEAECQEQLDDVKAAIALQSNPADLEAHCSNVDRFRDECQMAQALICAKHQSTIESDSHSAISRYVRVLISLRQFDEAETEIRRLQSKPVLERREQLLRKMRKQAPRLSIRSDAEADLENESTELRAELAACRGDLVQAIRLYKKLMESYPNAVYLRIELGRCLLKQCCVEEADECFRKALELVEEGYYGSAEEALVQRGHIQRMLGRYEAAAELYEQALQVEADDPGYVDPEYQTYLQDALAAADLAREFATGK